ncbi:DHHC zinc finger domain containing protein [Tritrichomonas foetus]|uniref:Palmitoyltransferase n=1 Tax=Tritrichomonas foetus TaxID=1144522 RepID=A0A1J4KSB9_9EUKA|nr:DHHC zinc finger domain containing protein [Tritrichomonas foetus]|eukprot:OHT12365.1 DHHC zinc finger domain containing protein [Tritrichomonas foetus]
MIDEIETQNEKPLDINPDDINPNDSNDEERIHDDFNQNPNEGETVFPGFSKWSRTSYCCFKNAIKVENIDSLFLGHWEIDVALPITVTIIIVSSYLVAMILIFPDLANLGIYMAPIFSILFFLFIYSYFRIIIDGPGYLPFYWPMSHHDNPLAAHHNESNGDDLSSLLDHDDLSPSGILSTSEQYLWARSRPRPNRCTLSKEGRRFVLRPDHVCGWTASWIGKRNYKFFLLFNFWGFVYIFTFTFFCVYEIIKQARSDFPSPILAVFYMYTFLALSFSLFTGSFCLSHTHQMLVNQTSWEEWKYIDSSYFDEGVKKNIEDVCGPMSKWYTYFCPISPWIGKTNEELISNYPPYPQMSKKMKKKATPVPPRAFKS